jgi:hypothetical protein
MSLKTHRVFCSAAFISDRRERIDLGYFPDSQPLAACGWYFSIFLLGNATTSAAAAVTQIF